jgi:hypothetical protein
MQMKTPEELAREYADQELDSHPMYINGLYDGFLAGYKAGCEVTDQEMADIIMDIRKREAEEKNKLPAHQQQRHDRIWEKIKVKIIGIF